MVATIHSPFFTYRPSLCVQHPVFSSIDVTHPHHLSPTPAHSVFPRHMTTSPLFTGRRF